MENKLLGEFLGFVALGAPLIALVLIIAGVVLVVWWFAHRNAGEPRRWRRAVIAGVVFLLIFTWDEILGRAYFYSLCATEGGVKVYKQVELPVEYWNEDGSPRFFPPDKTSAEPLINGQFEFQRDEMRKYPLNITGYTDTLIEKNNGIVIGTYTWLLYFGGWLINNTAIHVSGISCHSYKSSKYEDFVKYVLVQKKTGRGGN